MLGTVVRSHTVAEGSLSFIVQMLQKARLQRIRVTLPLSLVFRFPQNSRNVCKVGKCPAGNRVHDRVVVFAHIAVRLRVRPVHQYRIGRVLPRCGDFQKAVLRLEQIPVKGTVIAVSAQDVIIVFQGIAVSCIKIVVPCIYNCIIDIFHRPGAVGCQIFIAEPCKCIVIFKGIARQCVNQHIPLISSPLPGLGIHHQILVCGFDGILTEFIDPVQEFIRRMEFRLFV